MENKNGTPGAESTDYKEALETSTTSLTDLIDEMDRAAFRRSLASRDHAGSLDIVRQELRARSKD